MTKLWKNNTNNSKSTVSEKAEQFTVGNDYLLDQQLVPFDLLASRVHAKALADTGVLTAEEFSDISEALSEIDELWKAKKFRISQQDEDMHTAIEQFLVQKLGDTGKKIHTGRSRNDQVLTAMRLYEKNALDLIIQKTRKCVSALLDFGEKHEKLPMPGYTHTRKAMLSSTGLWAGGFAELLIMQITASSGIAGLINHSPLGTAAGYGSTIAINRDEEAEELGFDGPLVCATSAQLSRGWIELQFVQYLCGITAVLNRFAADVIQLSSEAYGFFKLDPDICTGSSIMPQKVNPDLAELIRAGHAELTGAAAALQTITTNLTSGYHRDLQLTKEPVIKAIQKTEQLLDASLLLATHITPNQSRLEEACSSDLFAAEAAYNLVINHDVPFREAYRIVKEKKEENLNLEHLTGKYSQLGSPGNPGLDRLREKLNQL